MKDSPCQLRNAMKILVLVLVALGCTAAASAKVRDVMDQLMAQVFILKPFIISESSFNDPANAARISDALQKMVVLSRQVSHEERISRTGFQVPAALLTQQLEDVENVFRNGNKDYALGNLRSTLGVCMSCHTQLPAVSTQFSALNESQVLTNPFDEAEFLFLIRNFDAAMTLYADLIKGYPLNNAEPDDLEKAVYRQVFYYVRVARDLQGLSIILQRDSANQQLPQRLQKQIKGLIAAVDAVQGDNYRQFTQAQAADLRNYAETQLSEELRGDFSLDAPENMIAALKFSSVLYEYLDANPTTPLKPEILYWLSFSERRYPYQSMYSLPDLYLKQCVLDYPKSAVAKQCLAEYEELITLGFTGSSGTHLPDDVKQELHSMHQLVDAP
jgi:hypothetical protein